MVLAQGKDFAGYRIERLLGVGGMARYTWHGTVTCRAPSP